MKRQGATPRNYARRELSPEATARLKKLIAAGGCTRAAALLRSTTHKLESAVAGLPTTTKTADVLEARLLELESQESSIAAGVIR